MGDRTVKMDVELPHMGALLATRKLGAVTSSGRR